MSKRANSNPFENVFYKGKNLPQTLFDLNAQINLFKAIGVQTDFVANLYDKVSRLQVGYQEVKNALNNLSNPTLAEVEQILKDKEYGAYFNALLLRANLNLQKLSPEERAKTIKEFLTLRINIGDLGLAIMSGRREVVSGLNDIENVLVQNECVKKYESIVQYLRKADKGDGNFQYNSEKMRQDLQDLRNLSEKVGLYELKQEIDSILIQNLFVNQGDNLKNLKEILRKYKGEINSLRKDAEKISAANTYDQLSQLSLSMDPNDIVAFNMALNDIMNNKDISEAEKIQKFAELVKQYKQKYKVGVRMSYETGADLGQDTVFKCRNKLMKYCTLSGLVNMLVGYAGITTVAVNAIASISSLVSSGIIGKDWDTAYKTVSSNMMYLGGGFGLAKYAKDRFNRDLDEPTWFYGTEGVKMAKWLDRDFDKRKKGENLNVSEGQQIGLMILGRRKFRDNDKGILMNTKLIRAVSKAEDNAKNIVSFEQLNDWYKKTADGQEDSNDLTKEEMIRFLELSYSKEELDWSEVLENNSEDGKAKEKEIVQTIINLVNYGRYPSRWSTERLSKTANACMKFLPKDKKEEFGVR
ncbi:hypothetical protein A2335_04705 [Candidatus Peregrinibacteria bacterium RIFOXYB2_FULL_32_7]|nr:MAG: hypothetical protein A2335_04705 [Candidatus Peregrinibacteria bacterium RIFOXYB2_FULL_32_7]